MTLAEQLRGQVCRLGGRPTGESENSRTRVPMRHIQLWSANSVIGGTLFNVDDDSEPGWGDPRQWSKVPCGAACRLR